MWTISSLISIRHWIAGPRLCQGLRSEATEQKMMTPKHRSGELGSGVVDHLVIGLVNNMPDGALRATERQFRGLLQAASHDVSTSLRYFSLPGVPRSSQAQTYI